MNEAPRVSVAVPVFNEAANLPELLDRLAAVLDATPGGPHEMVFVNDGSSDATLEILEARARADPRLVVVSLSRNFGQQAAYTAALDHVRGDAVILMDGDLQDTPESIPRFLERYREGYDVVYAVRVDRKEGFLLRFAYAFFYRLAARLSGTGMRVETGDFGLLSRRVVEELRRTREWHRYLRGLRAWVGFRQVGIPIERAERFAGRPKYSLRGLLRLASDGIFAFSVVPIRAATLVGFLTVAGSALFGLYSLYAKLVLHRSPQGFTALILVTMFMAGVQLLFLGVIGEYVGRIYEEVKRRPIYIVDRVIRASEPSGHR
ncbi:MAG: glycosyltransferase family 2 protein [Myxococcales bacterium]|nr:glycosyltransferase family 2 protein [Myxococcales bacterium]